MAGANPGSAGFVTAILVGSSAWLGDARLTSTTGNIASINKPGKLASAKFISFGTRMMPASDEHLTRYHLRLSMRAVDTFLGLSPLTRDRGENTGDNLPLLSYLYTKGISTSALQTRS